MTQEEIFEVLEEADRKTIDEYLDAVLNRKRELYPDWEICYLAIPRDTPEEKMEFYRAMKGLWEAHWQK